MYDLETNDVTMLRYRASERTLCLSEVFGEPAPLTAPDLSGRVDGDLGVDLGVDELRQRQDREVIKALLGR